MLKELAKEYHKKLYHIPPDTQDIAGFAEVILKQFIEELEEKQQSVVWNMGFGSVVFMDKINEMKEKYLGKGNNQGNSDEHDGSGTSGDTQTDKNKDLEDEQSKNTKKLESGLSEGNNQIDS